MSKVYITVDSDKTLNDSSRNIDGKGADEPIKFSFTNPWLSLKDGSLYPQYIAFQQSQMNYYTVVVLFLYTIVIVYRASRIVLTYPNALGYFNMFVAVVDIIAAGACCILRVFYNIPRFRKSVSLSISFLETVWLLGWNIISALSVLLSAINGHCKDEFTYGCSVTRNHLDYDKMFVAMMSAVLLYLVLRSAKWEVVIFSYVLNIVIIIAVLFHYNWQGSSGTFFSFLPFSALALYEYRRQFMRLFELNVQATRMMEEAQAVELRHMIGNVAHDLKTVSR